MPGMPGLSFYDVLRFSIRAASFFMGKVALMALAKGIC